jgi:predicted aldo/keto reductase-like oxidoreductase
MGSWNRRDFIVKPAGFIAASRLLGGSRYLFGQSGGTAAATQPALIQRTLGKTGIKLPVLSAGIAAVTTPGLLLRGYELGVRHFDTAGMYQQGKNEPMLGDAIKQMGAGARDKVIISTKLERPGGFGPPGMQQKVYSTAETKAHYDQALASSLKSLQTDYVDILLAHSLESEQEIASEGMLESFTEAKKAGRVRAIGFSTHKAEQALKTAMKLGVYDVVLLTFNHTVAGDDGLLKAIDEAATSGIGILAMKIMAGGTTQLPQDWYKTNPPANTSARLKWVLNNKSIAAAVVGCSSYDHLEQNVAVASNLKYTTEEENYLSNKAAAAAAQFCRNCGQCLADCPRGVAVPELMRTHMYEFQYGDHWLAKHTLASIEPGKGLDACLECPSCSAACRHSVDVAWKIGNLKESASAGRLKA